VLWYNFLAILPSLILAILILILGYCVAYLLGHATKWLLDKLISKPIREAELSKIVGHTHVASLMGELVKWFIFIIFLNVAVDILNLSTLSDLLAAFVRWLPNLLVAILIFFAGIALAHYVDMKIKEHTRMKGMLLMSGITKVVIVFLAILVGLEQIGVNVGVLESSFLMIVGSICLGLALALGIGLGLGLRGEAEDVIKRFKKNM
jgi:hypothetical protein